MSNCELTRRQALIGATATAGGAALGLGAGETIAKAPMASTQVPYFYRFPVGSFQATVLSDGPLPLGPASDTIKGMSKTEMDTALTANFLPTDNMVLEQNCLIVNTGERVILFDSGMGFSKAFGPTTGRLQQSLKEARMFADQVDDVICTHGHIDHIGGLADAKGRRLFPKATIHISKADYDFWTDEKKLANKDLAMFIKHARDNLLPYKDRIKFVENGKDVVPGVQAMSAPGHTVGHTVYVIKSGNKALAFTGDTTHHQILLTEKPRNEFSYDGDPKQAVESRMKVLDMIATDRIPLLAFHFPWPGYGYLGKQGDGFRYFAAPMEIVKIPPKKT